MGTMGDAIFSIKDEDKTLDAATHMEDLLACRYAINTGNRTITLPSPVAGQTYKFLVRSCCRRNRKSYYRDTRKH